MATFIDIAEVYTALEPGDRIVILLPIDVEHHAIFWGIDDDAQAWVIASSAANTVQFTAIERLLLPGVSFRIEKFMGSVTERAYALQRAAWIYATPNHVLKFNNEQFANHVLYDTFNDPPIGTNVATTVLSFTMSPLPTKRKKN